jgi:hypothetical protein
VRPIVQRPVRRPATRPATRPIPVRPRPPARRP